MILSNYIRYINILSKMKGINMRITKLKTINQFKKLKKGDFVVVEWKKGAEEYDSGQKITFNKIYGIMENEGEKLELILDYENNSYFNIQKYLNGSSLVKDAYLLKPELEIKGYNEKEVKCKAIWDAPKKCENKCCFECVNLEKCRKKDLECKIGNVLNYKECTKYNLLEE